MVALEASATPAHAPAATRRTDPLVGAWLLVVAVLVVVMILVGGATRLTDSGLSITEWRPVTGAIPPLSQADWAQEFAKYQATTEYQVQNQGMSLSDFQTIYWWEWGHRLLGRLIGLVYALPFLVFWLMGRLQGRFWACLSLLALGGLQGFVGWWMVQSGLTERLDVAPYRLATHLGLAFLILAGAVWLASGALGWLRTGASGVARPLALGFVGLLFLQILAGAAVAGSDAGKAYADWPTIGGQWLPEGYGALVPFWHNLFENHAAVQFNHRSLGYLVAAAALALAAIGWRRGQGAGQVAALALGGAAAAQVALGIATVLAAAPLGLSLAHQSLAVVLWLSAVGFLRTSVR